MSGESGVSPNFSFASCMFITVYGAPVSITAVMVWPSTVTGKVMRFCFTVIGTTAILSAGQ